MDYTKRKQRQKRTNFHMQCIHAQNDVLENQFIKMFSGEYICTEAYFKYNKNKFKLSDIVHILTKDGQIIQK